LTFCLWLLLHHANEQAKSKPQETASILTNRPPATPVQPQTLEQHQGTNAALPVKVSAAKTAAWPTAENSSQQALAAWQAPIEFYGKVLDENTNPVEGASVSFQWDESATVDVARTIATKSDLDGLFSLQGQHGRSLEVSVSKDGYYASRGDKTGYLYALTSEKFSPSMLNPVVFHLRKKGLGAELIQKDFPPGMGQYWQLHHDGTPIELDLLSGSQTVAGNGQLKLELWRDVSNMKRQPFDWKLQLSIPNGGLIETNEEFAFQAPKSGYQPSIVIDMPATNQNWQAEIRNKYYIQLPDGNYGRIDFYLLSRNGVFEVHSAINPTSSRNLEPK